MDNFLSHWNAPPREAFFEIPAFRSTTAGMTCYKKDPSFRFGLYCIVPIRYGIADNTGRRANGDPHHFTEHIPCSFPKDSR